MAIRTTLMGDRHVEDIARLFGAQQTPGSGNQWHSPIDHGQRHGSAEMVFRGECKSTRGEGITVTRKMLAKAMTQKTWGRLMLSLRWWDDDRCTRVGYDLTAFETSDAVELVERSNTLDAVRGLLEMFSNGQVRYPDRYGDQGIDDLAADLVAIIDGRLATRGDGLPAGGFPEAEG